ncbi:MAG: methyltransferase [Anaerolineae bacterium]|nr:methyltransferase [Anaerolineae bacterium]
MYQLFAVTQPGLEAITRQEMLSLGFSVHKPDPRSTESGGGVEFDASLAELYRANLYLRTPARILSRLGQFDATGFAELRSKAAKLPWHQYLNPSRPLAIRVTCHKSKLYHSDGVAERIAGAIGDSFRQPVSVVKFDEDEDKNLPQLVVVRLSHDLCTVSVDSSGALLHRRAYRLATAKAPLRENLAAALLLAAGWKTSAPLMDPFCGSGTLAIEAALMAGRIAPGKNRRFAFMDWPSYDSKLWQRLVNEAAAAEKTPEAPILASDRDAGAIKLAQANAERAGAAAYIQFTHQAFSAMQPPAQPGWLVCNPPYGVRVTSTHDLRNLYAQLGHVLTALCPAWQVGILCNSSYLVGHTRLKFPRTLSLVNGGIPVTFFMGQVPQP